MLYSNMESQPDGPLKIDNSAKSECHSWSMVEPISGSGRNVTVDNCFCSDQLCAELLKFHTIVGTLRKNKKEISLNFFDLKTLSLGVS